MAKQAKKVLPKTFSLQRFLRKVKDEEIRDDQDVQRMAGQWSNDMINELIITVLTNDYIPPIILAEEQDTKQLWIVDGAQRSAALRMFRHFNYKITSSVEDAIIEYETQIKDDNGKPMRDDDGNILRKMASFNVKNKTYSDLPKELKDIVDDYQLQTVTHLECTMKDISKLVRRYNKHTSMNTVQKAFTYLDDFARDIKGIVDHNFFKNCGSFTYKEKIKGAYNRIVCESVMAMFHLEDWKSSPKSICMYLNKNGKDDEFVQFEKCLDRLEKIIEKDNTLFKSKNAFIWITLFYEFTKTGLSDEKFVAFLQYFISKLSNKEMSEFDNRSFNTYDADKGTKDKKVVINKITVLKRMLSEYLSSDLDKPNERIDLLEFVKESVMENVAEDELKFYREILDDLTLNVDNNTPLLDEQNIPSLLALVAYSCEIDVDLDEWIVDYFDHHDSYIFDQKKNYEAMKADLDNYIRQKEKKAV